jgi:homoserine kinase
MTATQATLKAKMQASRKFCEPCAVFCWLPERRIPAHSRVPASVTIEVPATSANLGPGYDCLGLALDLHNRVTLTKLDGALRVEPAHSMVEQIAAMFFGQKEVDQPAFGFSWSIKGDVPRSRGLGSSVTVRLGVLMGLNELAGRPLGKDRLYRLCSEAEGHPDNVGPALFGGFVVASNNTEWIQFPVDDALGVVLLIPDYEVETSLARAALPEAVPHGHAARNTAHACTLVAAFATRQYDRIRNALADYLHQPYRKHLVHGLMDIIGAGVKAGALGGYLSGSGSAVACFTDAENATTIGEAMRKALEKTGHQGRALTTRVDNRGACVIV